jgi:signal transduction histidine kinase
MSRSDDISGRESLRSRLARDWHEIGGLGRWGIIGLLFVLVVTIILGFSITRAARGHLLQARALLIENAVHQLPFFPVDDTPGAAELAALDAAVRIHILGGETVRLKVWAPDGTIVYSDLPELIGQEFELSEPARVAFAGGTETQVSDLSEDAHEVDRSKGELIEIYVPVLDDDGEVGAVVEVEQDVTGLNDALGRISLNVWLLIAIGLAVLGVFLTALGIARAREMNRRRRQVEDLLTSSFEAQEEERRRIVGALHDDIGQPMYRVLYGLEGSRSRLGDDPVADELERIEGVVREMDDTLRKELRILQVELAADTGLDGALADLVDVTRDETDLVVSLSVADPLGSTREQDVEIYRAAREALMNVRKHAGAERVTMTVYGDRDRIIVDVSDDGVGYEGDRGLGLSTTRQRFETLGGGVEVSRRPGGGTLFRAWLPRQREETG